METLTIEEVRGLHCSDPRVLEIVKPLASQLGLYVEQTQNSLIFHNQHGGKSLYFYETGTVLDNLEYERKREQYGI